MMADYFSSFGLGVSGGSITYFVFSLLGYGMYQALKLSKHRKRRAQSMGNLLAATTAIEAFGTALTQAQTDAMELTVQGLPIGLAVIGTTLAITIGVKAFKRPAEQFRQYMAGGSIPARLSLSRGDLMAIDLYSGMPGSGKSLLVTHQAIDALLEHINAIPNFPMDMSYFKKRKQGKFSYIPTDKTTIKFLPVFVKQNHVREGRKAKKTQTVIIVDEAEIKFGNRMFSSPDRMEWIFFFADRRHFNYDSWLVVQSDRMTNRQIQDLIQTEFKCRTITGFGIEDKFVSSLFDGLSCVIPYDHASRTKSLLPQFYRLHKRKAKVHDTMYMLDGTTTAGKLEGGKKNVVSAKGQTVSD